MLDLGRTFLQSVERSPDAMAVSDGDVNLTYSQWHSLISRAATNLTKLGFERQDRLVVALQNRWEMATLYWACQVSGIVFVPLNWRAKAEELDYCLDDVDAVGVVFEAVSAEAVVASNAAQKILRIALDDIAGGTTAFQELLADVDGQEYESVAEAIDVSLILYTSGTTGNPKGVPRRHQHERAAAVAHMAQNHYARGERTMGVMPLYHTMGIRSLLTMALVDGLFVCIRRWDVTQALQAIVRHQISCLYLIPTLYHDLLSARNFAEFDTSSVRKLGFAGAPMNDALLKRVATTFNPEWFVNHYGCSEIYTVTINQNALAKPGCAGRAGLNTRLRVIALDTVETTNTIGVGQEGQIVVDLHSDEAFEGYWRRPDADAKTLREGWYLTGDTGFIDSDGDLFVTGRVDDMIISGGENISPIDVESVLSLHPGVDEVAVAGVLDSRWGQRVVAFVVRKAGVDEKSLDDYCRASTLVNFKRPREYIFVAEIPKSSVGKVLRRKLSNGDYKVEGVAAYEALIDGSGAA